MNNVILTAVLITAFFMCIKAYTIGLKHGKQLTNNQVPIINLNPVKPIVEAIETHEKKKEEQELTAQFDEVMSYTKESALDAIKKER